ncbi:IS200/IS605 family transposase [Lentilactobacillus buchneri]
MIKHERTNVYDFNFHLVWVTKYRKQVFTTDKRVADMKAILKGIAKRNSIEISSMEVMPDHIHMMISFAPKFTPSSIVKAFKGGSAKQWFIQYPETKQQLWEGHLWSPSFFMSTLGDVSKEVVSKYIKSQLERYNGGRPRR